MRVTKQMVERFLQWKLPTDFCPDGHIAFNKEAASAGSGHWPIGTNLLTATQARDMLKTILNKRQPKG